ncbi:MAG: hypothetical protein PHT24_04015 [Endomicrobiaceae bacterium]|nr:hypothetical protein [Endomicrobiaceae bacterium]
MKKFLMMLIAVALFVPAMASAQINWYGQLDIMGSMDREQGATNFADEYSYTNSRLFVGANFGLEENIEANIALMYKSGWGDNYLAGQQADNSSDTGLLSKTVLAEANVVFKNLFDNDRLSLKVGKFYYGEKGDAIFYVGLRDMSKWGYAYSETGWVAVYNGLDAGMDGAQLTYDDKEKLKVDLVYSKMANESDPGTSSKINMMIVNGKYKVNENISVRAYIYDSETTDYNVIGTDDFDANRAEIIGINPCIKFGALTASGEIAKVFSSRESKIFDENLKDSELVKLNAAYQFDLTGMTLTPRIQYLRAGDNFWSDISDANFGLISSTFNYWWGIWDIESMNIGADWTKGKYSASLDIYKNGYADGGYPWYEYDLIAKYKYTETIEFYAGYAYAVDQDGSDDWWESRTILGVNWKFGSK